MADRPYEVARLDDVPRHPARTEWVPLRRHFGIHAFGVNVWSAREDDDQIIPEHEESSTGHEELYLVLDGRASFTVDDAEVDAPAGTIVFVDDPGTQRKASAAEDGTTVLAIGATPGEAYVPLGWEWAASDVFKHFESGEPERAYELLAAADAEHPDSPSLLYNLACAEALTGRSEEAVDHLRRAVELYPPFAEIARDDGDFDAIRDHPGYAGA
jgi:tetratricopeptide (TPR) repeat protein